MTSNAALSPLAPSSALDANARPLVDGVSVATREIACAASDLPPDGAVPADAANENDRALSAAEFSSESYVEFVDAAGKIDWNAALSANESRLRSTIASRVGENAAVDEVFQDVALAATRQKAPIRDPRKVGAWLRRLATVYSLLYRRSLGRKRKLLQRLCYPQWLKKMLYKKTKQNKKTPQKMELNKKISQKTYWRKT